jgi:hypothetical protein
MLLLLNLGEGPQGNYKIQKTVKKVVLDENGNGEPSTAPRGAPETRRRGARKRKGYIVRDVITCEVVRCSVKGPSRRLEQTPEEMMEEYEADLDNRVREIVDLVFGRTPKEEPCSLKTEILDEGIYFFF